MKPAPLDPPATEAELDNASRVWTAAQDVMVARGFGRLLWGSQGKDCHDFIVILLRIVSADVYGKCSSSVLEALAASSKETKS